MALHMLVHSFMAGAAALMIVSAFATESAEWVNYLGVVMAVGIGVNLLTLLVELTMTHPTVDAHTVAEMITKGRYARSFYVGVVLVGNLLPLALLLMGGGQAMLMAAAVAILIGIYVTERIWVEAPQRIALS
ncbi:MAG: NrfD/PsrC family molybdoenzyme membrane anchor subunit [Saprospiraceae bacterium]